MPRNAKASPRATTERRLAQIEASLLSIERSLRDLSLRMYHVSSDLSGVRKATEALDEKYGKLLDIADGQARELTRIAHEMAANVSAHDRYERRLAAVEKRAASKSVTRSA
jgi:NRPS condensation-like uncharacterized protein